MTKTPAPDAAVLLPCPFCGGEAKVHGPYGWYRQYGITHSCKAFYTGAQDAFKNYPTVEYAIAAWNTRLATLAPAGGDYVLVPRAELADFADVIGNLIGELFDPGTGALAAHYRIKRLLAAAPPPPTSEPGADVDGLVEAIRAGKIGPAIIFGDSIVREDGRREIRRFDTGGRLVEHTINGAPVGDVDLADLRVLHWQIRETLDGIDRTETDGGEGWWETSEGAAFGKNVLAQIDAAFAAALSTSTAAGEDRS